MEPSRPYQIIDLIERTLLVGSSAGSNATIAINRTTSSKVLTIVTMIHRLHPGLTTLTGAEKSELADIAARLISALNKWYAVEFTPFPPVVEVQRQTDLERLRELIQKCRDLTPEEEVWILVRRIAETESLQRQATVAGIQEATGMNELAIEKALSQLIEDELVARMNGPVSAYRLTEAGWSMFHLQHASPDDAGETQKPVAAPTRVFLCYARQNQASVRKLFEHLKYLGVAPWMDVEDLVPGQLWEEEIHKAVNASDAVVVCLSKLSISKAGFLQKEIRMVLDKADEKVPGTIFVIPIRLEECEIPGRLSKLHYVDLFEKDGPFKLKQALDLVALKKKTAGLI
jgi:hypothetical protein